MIDGLRVFDEVMFRQSNPSNEGVKEYPVW